MTKGYNDGKWHGWNGGECPVHPETLVDVACRGAVNTERLPSGEFAWDHSDSWPDGDIVAFRVVEEYKEPREWWILHGKIYGYDCDPSAIHVREVLD